MQFEELKFYTTSEHPCSYIEGQQAKTVFLDPDARVDTEGYVYLSDLGFRRSGKHLYRPHCESCQACISIRVPSKTFKARQSQKRCWRRNQDLQVSWEHPELTDEIYFLYARYIEARHWDGDMYPPSPQQFHGFLVEGREETRFLCFRDGQGVLLAVAVVDVLPQGLSAVYTFYDPDSNRGLGVFAILWQLEYARQQTLPFVYLGYWVKSCKKMSYKLDYRPVQLLLNGQWLQCN
ncbi:arginyltransferase [Balneatrix alpica]|uniref:Aspartate/glutamate leucyltransferase n=1 Tax=Balneatrix alpica TaxID=75684 RepID=A0ABV5ZAL8_9GAMM|nr:arginyltransferase [Balneatrix alpica]